MAFTITYPAHPNRQIDEWAEGDRKARRVTLTFDNSYSAGGEVLLASELGWLAVYHFEPDGPAQNAAGTQAAVVVAKPNAARTQLNVFLYNENDAAAYAQRPRLAEVQAASDQSTMIVTGVIYGA